MKIASTLFAAAVAGAFLSASAVAAPVIYQGDDSNVSSTAQMINANAAAAAFDAAAPGLSVINFDSGLPAGISISGGTVTSNSGCGALCGFNTSGSGSNFLSLFGGSATFTFTAPVKAFGFYVTGLQTNLVPTETLTFSDGASQTIAVGTAINGGGAFLGFTDTNGVTSVTYNATNDIVAIDDVRFGIPSTVPEPENVVLIGAGLLALTIARRRRA